jgi:type II secretory pathway pseudopilin PulG
MVVILIVLAVSVLALPTLVAGLGERAVLSGAQSLQAALVAARDEAALAGSPRGIRLELDPSLPPVRLASGDINPLSVLAANRWTPMATAPDYDDGLCSAYPLEVYPAWVQPVTCLILEEQPGHWVNTGTAWVFMPNDPVTWWHNIRVGERLRIGDAGQPLTVCGPRFPETASGPLDSEGFTNGVLPGTAPFTRVYTAPDGTTTATVSPQWLMLVDGIDDNGDGFVDSGWDGLDNDGVNGFDLADVGEWEQERWPLSIRSGFSGKPYAIARRPVPSGASRTSYLPSSVVIDLTTSLPTTGYESRERSRVPIDPSTGSVVIMIDPDGRPRFDTPWSVPSSVGMGASWWHFWVTDRSSVHAPVPGSSWSLLGDFSPARNQVVSVNRTGRISVVDPGTAFDAAGSGLKSRQPFINIEQ